MHDSDDVKSLRTENKLLRQQVHNLQTRNEGLEEQNKELRDQVQESLSALDEMRALWREADRLTKDLAPEYDGLLQRYQRLKSAYHSSSQRDVVVHALPPDPLSLFGVPVHNPSALQSEINELKREFQ